MEYEIVISDSCLEEIEEICDYIERVLKAKDASNRLRKEIKDTIKQIKSSPRMYAEIGKTDRQGRVYRRAVINNYIIYNR